jgi:hypothetical protein
MISLREESEEDFRARIETGGLKRPRHDFTIGHRQFWVDEEVIPEVHENLIHL